METAVWVKSQENPGYSVRERNLSVREVAEQIAASLEKTGLVDEYISTHSARPLEGSVMPADFRWVVYTVEGGNEGHYVHVAYKAYVNQEPQIVEMVLVKTLGGWTKAFEIANWLTMFVHE